MKFNIKNLKKALSIIYNCSHYRSVDIYHSEGVFYFTTCQKGCSTWMDGCDLVGSISRSHNFGPQYSISQCDDGRYLGDLRKYWEEKLTVKQIIEILKSA